MTEIPTDSAEPNLAQPAQDLPPPEILSIPWFHNVVLIQKIKIAVTVEEIRIEDAARAVHDAFGLGKLPA